jgi:hypothetical protein
VLEGVSIYCVCCITRGENGEEDHPHLFFVYFLLFLSMTVIIFLLPSIFWRGFVLCVYIEMLLVISLLIIDLEGAGDRNKKMVM